MSCALIENRDVSKSRQRQESTSLPRFRIATYVLSIGFTITANAGPGQAFMDDGQRRPESLSASVPLMMIVKLMIPRVQLTRMVTLMAKVGLRMPGRSHYLETA